MPRSLRLTLAALCLTVAVGGGLWFTMAPAEAALRTGARAPDFTAPAAQGGRRFNVTLSRLLQRGPVVIYFFPRVFTDGCTIESRAFAAAVPDFRAAGATVLGMSADSVADLARFSTQECRSAFPMAQASSTVISGYQVALARVPGVTMSDRTSYVIAQDGTIALAHSDMNPNDHVRETLAAVQRLQVARQAARR